MAAYMEVHMVVEMVADKKRGRHGKKMADMEFDMVVDMEVDKVADMVVDELTNILVGEVTNMEVDMVADIKRNTILNETILT